MIYKDLQCEQIPELAQLYKEAFNAPPWNDKWTLESASNRLVQMLKCDGVYGLVGYEENKIVGMILGHREYYYNGIHFNIKEFCVDINLRGNGIGSALLDEFMKRLKGKGIDQVILLTSRTDGTEGFYKYHGFESIEGMVLMGKPMVTKKIYLTIDDAPSMDFKEKVDFLYERNVQAIFFCIGKNLIKHEDDVVYAISRGFVVGNHSFNHGYFSDMTLDECKASIKTTEEIIERLYKKSNIVRPMKLFRFPYFDQGGDKNSEAYEGRGTKPPVYRNNDKRLAIQAFLKELGYTQPKFQGINMKFLSDKTLLDGVDVRCTFNQMEYCFHGENVPDGMDKAERILHRIDEDVPYEGRSLNCFETSDIILLHDHENTTGLFYKIIDRYLEKGFEFLIPLGTVIKKQ